MSFRWACNKRLRVAITTIADNCRHANPGPSTSTAAPATAARTPDAVRILARAWTRAIWRCWIDQQLYGPTYHGVATQLLDLPTAA